MRWNLWESESEMMFIREDREKDAPMPPDAVVVWSVEAETHNEAHSRWYEYMGRGPYVPFGDEEEEGEGPASDT